jgi:hypothetical protein
MEVQEAVLGSAGGRDDDPKRPDSWCMATVINTVRRRYDPAAIMLELRNGRQLYSLRLPTVVFESRAARLAAWLLSIESGAARKMELRMREPPGEPDL